MYLLSAAREVYRLARMRGVDAARAERAQRRLELHILLAARREQRLEPRPPLGERSSEGDGACARGHAKRVAYKWRQGRVVIEASGGPAFGVAARDERGD